MRSERPIYVAGHRNPDSDSIASAIGYAELKGRLDPDNRYVPVRLGDSNQQTRWLLERSGAPEPVNLPHVMLRAGDVMRQRFPVARHDDPVREAGRAMMRADLELVPIVDADGTLVGVLTERALARRFVRDSLRTSTLEESPTELHAVVAALEGELVAGSGRLLAGRVWVYAMEVAGDVGISPGDIVVVGDRPKAQLGAIELGADLLVLSNSVRPPPEVLGLASDRGAAIVVSPLDSYVAARMITLASPCGALMERDPLTVTVEHLLDDISAQVKESHHGAAVAVDADNRPVGLVTRADLVAPPRRRIVLVDHAERAQSAIGIDDAEILEILDHHHIGSIETRVPVRATFDPVGSTATLVVERFRQAGMEPSRPTAMMLLGAVLSDTVILNSATTTERDRAVVAYLERVLALDAVALGREMFEQTSDVSGLSAREIVTRDAKRYQLRSGQEICIAQVEVVGDSLLERSGELLDALHSERTQRELAMYALMVTDVAARDTVMLVSGDAAAVARSFGTRAHDGAVRLPGVMSRKKEVAPRLMTAL